MYKNYFKIGWRSLLRNKSYSLINISGLAMGMAVAMLIGLWVNDELSFNKSFKNYDRLSGIYHHLTFGEDIFTENSIPYPFGSQLKNNFPEVEEVAMTSFAGEHLVTFEENKISRTGLFVDPVFLHMFSIPLLQGTSSSLKDIQSILLSKKLADVLVGDNPVGKMIRFDNRDQLMITGVFEDFQANSEFTDVSMLLPMEYHFSNSDATRTQLNNWEDFSFQCFVLLNEKASPVDTEAKLKNLLYQNISGDGKSLKPEGILLPMSKWHLYAEFKNGVTTGGKIQSVWMIGLIGTFVLLLACINFMNLSTARSEKRSKEVGIRKVMGSLRAQLVNQFLSESLLVVIISFFLAIIMVALSLSLFNNLSGKQLSIPWSDTYFLIGSLVFVIITSLLAGSYPALYLSSFNPVRVLKGTFKAGRYAVIPRKVLVVFQFTISTALIIATIIIFQQIQHAKDRSPGFDREGIIQLSIRTEDLANADYNSLRHELLATGVVENMAKSDFPITGSMAGDASLTWQGKDPAFRPLVAINKCSHDFPMTNGFKFIAGRDFSREFASDSSAVIINEMAANLFPDGDAIGKHFQFASGKKLEIIGVIKDQVRWTPFVNQSPHMYFINYKGMGYLTIRLNSHVDVASALTKIEDVIKKYDAGAPFDYKFQDDDYARLFHAEERLGKLTTVFAALAIVISCIGIFGLASFAVSQRTKEIGIRKVLGATVFSIWKLLSGNFAGLVLISFLLAAPLAYYFANQWLQQYDYKIEIEWPVFAVTGVLALVLTILTVSFQSIKAAWMNPVTSLRSE